MNTTITTIPTMTTDDHTDPSAYRPPRPLIRGTLVGGASALAANSGVFALGSIGDPIRVVIGSDSAPAPLRLFEVVATTVVAFAFGTLVVWAARRRRLADRVWTVAAVVVSVASAIPLWRLEIDTTSKVLLTTMHLLTGACFVAAHTTHTTRA